MKKRLMLLMSFVLILSVVITGCLAGKPPQQDSAKSSSAVTKGDPAASSNNVPKDSAKPVVLRYLTSNGGPQLQAEQQITDKFMKANPNIKVEVTSVPGTQEFVTALKAKFAAGEEPDLYLFQGGNRTIEFAKAGLLYDLTDEPFMSQAKPEDLPFNSYNGRVYGFPIDYQLTGLFINMDVFKKYTDVKIPESFPELLNACEKIKQQGFKSPMLIAGKDINNVAQFDFQYLSTVVLFNNPDYYKEILDGKRKFNDPFIREMFNKFAQIRNYMSADSLGVDNEEAIKRFVRGDGVFWIAHGSTIPRIRELAGKDFNFIVVPTVLQDKPEDRVFNVGLTLAIHIVKSTKNLDAAKAYMANHVSKESGEAMVKVGGMISAYKGVDVVPDSAIEPCLKWLSSNRKSPHADLVWIPGIKDVMKEVTQKWYMGEPIDNVLNEWESQHQRLLKANPDFIKNYGKQ